MNDTLRVPVDPEEVVVEKSHLGFPVVGIGASAGGVSALRTLFENLPASVGMAFVVVVHLSPSHESSLAAILQRCTAMPVKEASASIPIEVDHVYVISPAKRLQMTDGHLVVFDAPVEAGRRAAIDVFFRTLAQAHQERSVGILLSGAGSDGTQGLKRLKELGGVAIAQMPSDAEFDAMPRNAIASGLIDVTLPASEIPQWLVELWDNARALRLPGPPPDMEVLNDTSGRAAEDALRAIKGLLQERTGHDFEHYKRATVLRRLERRMQVVFAPDLPAYLEHLYLHPEETAPLLQDMLISVTNFFRDRDAFEALERELAERPPERGAEGAARAWIAGCATGEEAYSIAMLLTNVLGSAPQVFATDIDQRAIAIARKAIYPDSILTDVPPSDLRLHFDHESDTYRVAKPIRDSVLFSTHNVLRDPPFSRVDLICCRNLLIYLDREGQTQLLRTFHFALNPGGLLFLGKAETAEFPEGLFQVVDKKQRLYRAAPAARPPRQTPILSALRTSAAAAAALSRSVAQAPVAPVHELHALALAELAPATVLIDASRNILLVSEGATALLRVASGAPTSDIVESALPELRADLRATLYRSRELRATARSRPVALSAQGSPRWVVISARPSESKATEGLTLVLFEDVKPTVHPLSEVDTQTDGAMSALEAESRELQRTILERAEESAASTEELKAANEELQSINEELRSATEELETSREEAQSVNEELSTVNHELRVNIDEADKVNDDLRNLIASTDIGTVFVDRALRVKRFTPRAAALFNLIDADVGRSLLDITHRLDYPSLAPDLDEVFKTLRESEREVRALDGRWFIARALPYRTSEDRIDGAILNLIDISARRQAEESLREAERRMLLVAESMRDYAIFTLDVDGRIASWSAGAERLYGYCASEALGRPSSLLFTVQDIDAGAPDRELTTTRQLGRLEDDRWHRRKDGSTFFFSGVTTTLGEGEPVGFAKIGRDITAGKLADAQREAALGNEIAGRAKLEAGSVMKDEFFAVMSHELKNPLSLILLNADSLLRRAANPEPASVARAAGAIRRAVASQTQIIDDLLDWSRASTGKLSLVPARVDAAPIFERVVEALGAQVAKRRQRLSSELDDSLALWADSVRVEQIAWNLLTNATKFTPDGGAIAVSVRKDGAFALVEVADTGIGMSHDDLSKMFDMFQQSERGAARTAGGLGIGLALVKRLAELHGGKVEAASPGIGLGATMRVWLPLDSGSEAPASAAREQSALEGMAILLVGHDAETLEALAELLECEGSRVVAVDSAASALEQAQASPFDLIVTDIPDHDGYQLIARLREIPSAYRATAIAVSGLTRPADLERTLATGFDAHLSKPLDSGALITEVVRLKAARMG